MPIHQRWDEPTRTLFVRMQDPVENEEFLNWARSLYRDAKFPPGRRELVDLRGLASSPMEIDSANLRELASAFRSRDVNDEQSRVALVATRDVLYGLSRMYQAFRCDSSAVLEVFRDEAEARAWLGLPKDTPGA